jgi:hypothetical protein
MRVMLDIKSIGMVDLDRIETMLDPKSPYLDRLGVSEAMREQPVNFESTR